LDGNNKRSILLSQLPNITLTLIVRQYAQEWHLGKAKKGTLTQTVEAWQEYWPEVIPLPHPSPRNNIWMKKNLWFKGEVLSALKSRVRQALALR